MKTLFVLENNELLVYPANSKIYVVETNLSEDEDGQIYGHEIIETLCKTVIKKDINTHIYYIADEFDECRDGIYVSTWKPLCPEEVIHAIELAINEEE